MRYEIRVMSYKVRRVIRLFIKPKTSNLNPSPFNTSTLQLFNFKLLNFPLLHSSTYYASIRPYTCGASRNITRTCSSISNNWLTVSARSMAMRVWRKLGMPLNKGEAARWRRT